MKNICHVKISEVTFRLIFFQEIAANVSSNMLTRNKIFSVMLF